MKPNTINLSQLQSKTFDFEKTTTKINLSNVISDKGEYLNSLRLFVAYFNAIPNFVFESNINSKKAHKFFLENYKAEIKDFYFSDRTHYYGTPPFVEHENFYFLYEDLIVKFDFSGTVRLYFRKTDIAKVEAVVAGIKKFKNPKTKPKINLLVSTLSGIETRSMDVSKPKLNIEDNYNDDFKEVHQTILKRLSKKNDKGLVLLHGKPGTGKTSYIRYLITALKKNVIFLPPNMAGAITNPNLISVLIDNPNSVFVIEDAENIVIDRELDGCSPVSALLNIADGLLSDCLNIQIICSFNTDLSKVDSALMRKGRLIAKYEFKELKAEKASKLSHKLGLNPFITVPMTLAAIYNQDEKDFQQTNRKNPIGFKTILADAN